MIIQGSNTEFKCPHCGENQPGVVGDYIVQGPLGLLQTTYRQDCGDCDRYYTVRRNHGTDSYEVRRAIGSR